MKEQQAGRSMVEMVLVIGIIGVLTMTIMKTIGNVYERWQLSCIASELRDIQKNITRRYAVSGYYDSIKDMDAQDLLEEKMVPESVVKGSGMMHTAGGQIVIEPVKASGGNYSACSTSCDKYGVTFKSLSPRSCLDMVSLNWQVKGGTDLVAVCKGSSCAEWGGTGDLALPATAGLVNKFCSSDKNDIRWIFQ